MISNKDIKLIENYMDNLLEGKELVDFQNRLASDIDFANEYKLRVKIAGLWKDADEHQKIKRQINGIINDEKRSDNFASGKMYYLLAIAASVILFIGIYLVLQNNNQLPWSQKGQMAITEDTITFRQDIPESFAKIDYTYKLIAPAKDQHFELNDTITFHWKIFGNLKKIDLIILNRQTKDTVFQNPVFPSDSQLITNANALGSGEFEWYINDTIIHRFFTINKKEKQ